MDLNDFSVLFQQTIEDLKKNVKENINETVSREINKKANDLFGLFLKQLCETVINATAQSGGDTVANSAEENNNTGEANSGEENRTEEDNSGEANRTDEANSTEANRPVAIKTEEEEVNVSLPTKQPADLPEKSDAQETSLSKPPLPFDPFKLEYRSLKLEDESSAEENNTGEANSGEENRVEEDNSGEANRTEEANSPEANRTDEANSTEANRTDEANSPEANRPVAIKTEEEVNVSLPLAQPEKSDAQETSFSKPPLPFDPFKLEYRSLKLEHESSDEENFYKGADDLPQGAEPTSDTNEDEDEEDYSDDDDSDEDYKVGEDEEDDEDEDDEDEDDDEFKIAVPPKKPRGVFVCPVPSCRLKFACRNSLSNHFKMHLGGVSILAPQIEPARNSHSSHSDGPL